MQKAQSTQSGHLGKGRGHALRCYAVEALIGIIWLKTRLSS